MEAWLKSSFTLAQTDSLETLSLEVSKEGKAAEMVQLGRKPVLLIGKHSSCDLQLEHPSISRPEALLPFNVCHSSLRTLLRIFSLVAHCSYMKGMTTPSLYLELALPPPTGISARLPPLPENV